MCVRVCGGGWAMDVIGSNITQQINNSSADPLTRTPSLSLNVIEAFIASQKGTNHSDLAQ